MQRTDAEEGEEAEATSSFIWGEDSSVSSASVLILTLQLSPSQHHAKDDDGAAASV